MFPNAHEMYPPQLDLFDFADLTTGQGGGVAREVDRNNCLSHMIISIVSLQLKPFPKLVAPGRAAYTLARQTCRLIDSMVSTLPPTKIIPFGRGFLGLCTGVVIIAKFEVLFFVILTCLVPLCAPEQEQFPLQKLY